MSNNTIKENQKTEPLRTRISIPKNDEVVIKWLQAQSNVSYSIRTLIKNSVQEYGLTDVTCLPVKKLTRKQSEKYVVETDDEIIKPKTITKTKKQHIEQNIDQDIEENIKQNDNQTNTSLQYEQSTPSYKNDNYENNNDKTDNVMNTTNHSTNDYTINNYDTNNNSSNVDIESLINNNKNTTETNETSLKDILGI